MAGMNSGTDRHWRTQRLDPRGDTPTPMSRQPPSAVLLGLVKIIENWF